MVVEIKVPNLGESLSFATIATWYKGVNDSVKEGDCIGLLETDKSSFEIEAPCDGVIIELKNNAGEDVKVGDLIVVMSEEQEENSSLDDKEENLYAEKENDDLDYSILKQDIDKHSFFSNNEASSEEPQPNKEDIKSVDATPPPPPIVDSSLSVADDFEEVEIKVPSLGESLNVATIATWYKRVGDVVKEGEIVALLETDKSSFELEAPCDGVVLELKNSEQEDVSIGQVIVTIAKKDNGASLVENKHQDIHSLSEEDEVLKNSDEMMRSLFNRIAQVKNKVGEDATEQEEDKDFLLDEARKGSSLDAENKDFDEINKEVSLDEEEQSPLLDEARKEPSLDVENKDFDEVNKEVSLDEEEQSPLLDKARKEPSFDAENKDFDEINKEVSLDEEEQSPLLDKARKEPSFDVENKDFDEVNTLDEEEQSPLLDEARKEPSLDVENKDLSSDEEEALVVKSGPAVSNLLANNSSVALNKIESPSGKEQRLTKGDILNQLVDKDDAKLGPVKHDDVLTESSSVKKKPKTLGIDETHPNVVTESKKWPKPLPKFSDKRVDKVDISGETIVYSHVLENNNYIVSNSIFEDINISSLQSLINEYSTEFFSQYRVSLSLLSFFIKATVFALRKNSALYKEGASSSDDVNLAYSKFEYGDKQIAPVIHKAQTFSLQQLSQMIEVLQKKGKSLSLKPEQLIGHNFVLLDYQNAEFKSSSAMVADDGVSILAFHRVEERPIVIKGQIEIQNIMQVSLSYDFNKIAIEQAVTFIKNLKLQLEDPKRLLLSL